MKQFLFYFYISTLILLHHGIHSLVSFSQYEELINFYYSTNGEEWNWADSEPWDLKTDPCVNSWTGIQCNNSNILCQTEICGILSINLPNFGLQNNLPSTFGVFSDLQSLILSENNLIGEIPFILSVLSQLKVLSLGSNFFNSSIPSELGKLHSLEILDLSKNHITGLIPETFNSSLFASSITSLHLGNNYISGPFPTFIAHSSNLRQLSLNMNKFHGNLPSSLCLHQNLDYFGIASNKFDGDLPSCLYNLSALEYFYITNNSFCGPLPSLRYSFNLTYFQANGNHLSGSLFSEYGALLKLQVLELGRNSLTGTIPSEIGYLTNLYTLYLHDNLLSGSIPSQIGNLVALEFLILFENSLTGTIPPSMGSLCGLKELVLHTNNLRGAIPSSMALLTNLRIFLIQNNHFTDFNEPEGESFLSPTLEHIDISNNQFKGPISAIPFESFPRLRTLAAVENCFSGSLPSEICSPRGLEVLALDGLASGFNCRIHFFDPFHLTDSYLSQSLEGTVPPCVWDLPNLTVLHLSGNGLTGTLPTHIPSTSKLINISFAHNRLTGTIPKFLLKTPYLELCLSYNKLTGSLDSNDFYNSNNTEPEAVVTRKILALENNRLSGYLPTYVDQIPTLTILQGNLFDCDKQHPLPSNDPKEGDYICGSQQLDQALIFWGCVVGIWLLILFLIIYITYHYPDSRFHIVNEMTSNPSKTQLRGNLSSSCNSDIQFSQWIPNIIRWNHFGKIQSIHILTKQLQINLNFLKIFLSLLTMIRKTYCTIGIMILFLGLPLYLGLKTKYSTHEYQYGWFFSAAYMSGLIPSILLLLFYTIVTCVVGYSFVTFYPLSQSDDEFIFHDSLSGDNYRESNCIPTRELNLSRSTSLGSSSQYSTSISKSMTTTTTSIPERDTKIHVKKNNHTSTNNYNKILFQFLIFTTAISINILVFLSANSLYVYLLLSGSKYMYRIFAKLGISLFALFWNMFFLPSLLDYCSYLLQEYTTSSTGSSTSTSSPSSQYKWILILLLLFNNIAVPGLATAASDASCFDDIFIYKNKINAYYSYLFCELYSMTPISILSPKNIFSNGTSTDNECLQYTISGVSTSYSPPFFYNYSCASAILENYIPVYFISYAIITIFPLLAFLIFHSPWEITSYFPSWCLDYIPYLWRSPASYPFLPNYDSNKLFKPNRILCNTLSHLSIMITFGIAYPFLALAIVIAVCIVTWYHELTIGRYLEYRFFLYSTLQSTGTTSNTTTSSSLASSPPSSIDISGGINSSCSDVLFSLSTCLWTIFIGSSILFSFLIFDFAGDQMTWDEAMILAGGTCLIPILFAWLSFKLALYWSKNRKSGEYYLIPQDEDDEDGDGDDNEAVDI